MTPTPTQTPTATATPRELCRVVVINVNSIRVRARPTTEGSIVVGWLAPGTVAPVLRQQREDRNPTGPVWYFISVTVDDASVEGWIRSDIVHVDPGTRCPPVP